MNAAPMRPHRCQFERLPFDIERNRQRADLRRGENNFQMLDAIADRQSDTVALLHAERQQPVRELVDSSVQLAVGRLAKLVLSGNLDAETSTRSVADRRPLTLECLCPYSFGLYIAEANR